MSRIVLTTFGSAGDLNPMLALGIGLRERGHDVLFAVEDNFRPSIIEAGFAVRRLAGDSVAAIAPYAAQMFGSRTPATSIKLLLDHYLLPTLPEKITDLRAACEGADLLVSSAMHMAAAAVADLTRIPWASVALTPIILPSSHVDVQPLPAWLPAAARRLDNRLLWRLGEIMFRGPADAPANQVRASFGLPPRHGVLWLGSLSPRLTCLACSPAFQPPVPDWPDFVRVTGFCYWDTPAQWSPSPALRAFLDDPTPVIAVTAGSIAPGMASAFASMYRTSVQAIRRVGAQALLIGGQLDQLMDVSAPDVLAVPFAPYSQVFPRCAAVIHHGGIGTAAQCLRYGIPALVVPQGFDQYYVAARIARIDAGRMLYRDRFTLERATEALAALLHEPRYTQATRGIRDQIAGEDGVGQLCAALEPLLRGAATRA